MQLKQRIKRLAALLLAMSMALGCMPGSAWAETATPTDLIATSGEALPDTTLPSATPEPEGESGVPGTENSETTDSPGNEITETDGEMDSGNPLPIQTAILEQGHVYAATVRQTCVYSNPMMAGTVKEIQSENGKYLVTTTKDGYSIEKEGEENPIELKFNGEEQSWNVVSNGKTYEILKLREDGTVDMNLQNGQYLNVTPDAQGVKQAHDMIMSTTYYAAR